MVETLHNFTDSVFSCRFNYCKANRKRIKTAYKRAIQDGWDAYLLAEVNASINNIFKIVKYGDII